MLRPRWRVCTAVNRCRCQLSSSTSFRSRVNVIDELESRGLVAQMSSRKLREHVDGNNQKRVVYLGIDPSAPSLHIGHLVTIVSVLHFVRYGHRAIALIGGGTGSIGDPSGRSTERNSLDSNVLERNCKSIKNQVSTLIQNTLDHVKRTHLNRETIEFEQEEVKWGDVRVVDNRDWLGSMGLLDFLSRIGKRVRVSTMLSRDSVKSRLDSSSGISFTEFTYQLLQAFDFITLNKKYNCTIQLGGNDQWGNIMTGIEIMLRSSRDEEREQQNSEMFGMTCPLLLNSRGEKLGKSLGNALWLDLNLTCSIDLYQFFIKISDQDVQRYLNLLTFCSRQSIDDVMIRHREKPELRKAQHLLATELIQMIHGRQVLERVQLASSILFSKDLLPSLLKTSPNSISLAFENSPHLTSIRKSQLQNMSLLQLITLCQLCQSKGEAREAIKSGSIAINHSTIRDPKFEFSNDGFLTNSVMVLTRGKASKFKVIKVTDDVQ